MGDVVWGFFLCVWFGMASLAASVRCSQFSSLGLNAKRISRNYGLPRTPSLVSASPFSALPEIRVSAAPVQFSGNALKFAGWDPLLRRQGGAGVKLPVPAAAAADADGLGFISPFFLFHSKFWVACFSYIFSATKRSIINCYNWITDTHGVTAVLQSLQRALQRNSPSWSPDSFSLCGRLFLTCLIPFLLSLPCKI